MPEAGDSLFGSLTCKPPLGEFSIDPDANGVDAVSLVGFDRFVISMANS